MAASGIVLLGPPASGKGTQGRMLAESGGRAYFSTGKQLRREIEAGSELGRLAAPLLAAGKYVPDELAFALVFEWLDEAEGGWVLDGFPRTLVQAERFDRFLSPAEGQLRAVLLEVAPAELERRVAERRECTECSWTGTRALAEPSGGCPACGGELGQRSDDDRENFRMRLKAFDELTTPVAHYYEASGRLCRVNGTGAPDEVFQQLRTELEFH